MKIEKNGAFIKAKTNGKWKMVFATILLVILLVSTFGYLFVKKVNDFFHTNYLQFNAPVEVVINPIIEIKKREPEVRQIVLDYPDEIDTPMEKYICEKFGPYDCKIALAIVKAESGFKEEAFHVNKDGSVDFGCWQVNSIHLKKGVLVKDLLDCQKATDWIYENLFKEQKWNPWVQFQNGSFLKYID